MYILLFYTYTRKHAVPTFLSTFIQTKGHACTHEHAHTHYIIFYPPLCCVCILGLLKKNFFIKPGVCLLISLEHEKRV